MKIYLSPASFAYLAVASMFAILSDITCMTTQGITKPKEVRRFKGEGMPLHFSTKKGDLYVTFEVLFPTSLTEDQKTKIKEILG